MLGLLLVTHHRQLAEGVRAFLHHVAPDVPVTIAAETGDPGRPFGTDPKRVLDALQALLARPEVDAVMVFADVGSALASAEAAWRSLEAPRRKRVYLAAAPLVEGAMTAAVLARDNAPVDTIWREAHQAFQSKTALAATADSPWARAETLSPEGRAPSEPSVAIPEPAVGGERSSLPDAPPDAEVRVRITNPLGLHARPVAQLVQRASRYPRARVFIGNATRGASPVPLTSLPQVLALAVRQGDEVVLQAWGEGAREVVSDLAAYLSALAERPLPVAERNTAARVYETPDEGMIMEGTGISPGVALGPVIMPRAGWPSVPDTPAEAPATEWARFQQAREQVDEELQRLQEDARQRLGREQAEIFLAHRLILQDPDVVEKIREKIFTAHLTAARAVHETLETIARSLEEVDDVLIQARAQDIRDVGARLLNRLLGAVERADFPPRPAIIVAEEVQPYQLLHWRREHVLGLATVRGGPTTHAAILARGMNIPAVSGLPEGVLNLPEGTLVGLDGHEGRLWVRPTEKVAARLQQAMEARRRRWAQALANAREPAITADGVPIAVLANVRSPEEAEEAVQMGAQGAGLVRTEFLYLHREHPPTEEEQVEFYRAILAAFGDRPVTIRTADIGGDKPIPYLHIREDNPFLGLRGVRLSLAFPELFRTQLRALLRAAHGHHVNIMFPMVGRVAEWEEAMGHLREVQQELEEAHVPFNRHVKVGMMIEVPSAAVLVEPFVEAGVAFFSIGSNDLAQYVLAADRTHPRVGPLADGLHPAVLWMIHHVARTARARGVPVSLCGELAGDMDAVPVLLGLGVHTLSVAPGHIPLVKERIREIAVSQAETLAQTLLHFPRASEVREAVRERFTQRTP